MTATKTTAPVSRAAFATLAAALALGVLGDILFKDTAAPGINFLIFAVALTAAARQLMTRAPGDTLRGQGHWLLIAIGFATCLAVRDAEMLRAFDILAILLALGMASLGWFAKSRGTARLRDMVLALVHTGSHVALGPILLLVRDADWSALRQKRTRHLTSIVAGLALAVPILLVFGGLFSAADAGFAAFIETLFGWNVEPVIIHTFITGAIAWTSAGLLRAWLFKPALPGFIEFKPSVQPSSPSALQPGNAVAIGIALGAMVAIFTLFVALQARYLFGGLETIRSVDGLYIADYARDGFFQMVFATALVVPVLYGADVLLTEGSPVRSIRALGSVQLLLTLCVMASAVQRMMIYVGAFGLTEDRIVASTILAWLGAVIVWFALTVQRGRRERFMRGALASGLVALGGLNAINPHALIARTNTTKGAQVAVDADYLAQLSADAVPTLVAYAQGLPPAARCDLTTRILTTMSKHAALPDWRTWNLDRTRASAGLRELAREPVCTATEGAVGR